MSSSNFSLRAQPLFRLIHFESLQCPSDWQENSQFVEDYRLLLITGGKGELFIDNRRYSLHQGKIFLLIPSMLIEMRSEAERPLQFYRMTFQALRESNETKREASFVKLQGDVLFPQYGERSKRTFNEALQMMKQLQDQLNGQDGKLANHYFLLFHQLLDLLFQQEDEIGMPDAAEAIKQTIDYMERHYQEELSRDTLAAIAGMSPWHFSRKFKEITGCRPSDRLEAIRIHHAKEHLLRLGDNIREVAHLTGYRDEAYFRSKFKQSVGLSPTMFMTRKREKIAALSYHYAAHLLTLEVIPFATYVERSRESHRSQYHDIIPFHLKRAKQMNTEVWEQNLRALAGAKPEVILCDGLVDREVLACMEKIAPVVSIPWLELDWRNHFREISSFAGQKRKAEHWMSSYDRKAEQLRKQWQGKFDRNRVCVLHLMSGDLYVYSTRNGGSVLYEDLQLVPAHDMTDIQVCERITVDDLVQYDADLLFIAIDQDRPSMQSWNRLQSSAQWQSLQAVRRGAAHVIQEIPWLEYSPYAHSMVLDEAGRIFG
ncbi:helix-turn-helix domain-containing protein [Paenibacillus sp. NPDC058071]|uniref:helix-turn-helix domain-containing protein n=1 Tax=Paenibacillus sp. NPDC058071 TaxID=3346326 RepID=UPI0036D96860